MSVLSLQQADIFRMLQGRHIKWLVVGINLLLVVWIASLLASLTWSLATPPDEVLVDVDTPAPAALASDPNVLLIRQLPGWHLMGKVDDQSPVLVEAPLDAPDTRLKLVLHGVFASAIAGKARAIIADPKGKEEQYAVGDKLPGNAELSEVYPDRVILKRNGRYETLRMSEGSIKGVDWTMPASRKRGGATGGRVRAIPNRLMQDPKTLIAVVRPKPYMDKDRNMIGYSLQPGAEKELFTDLGLVAGDVAIEINGVKLDSAAKGMQVMRSIKSGDMGNLTILRDGQEQVLSFQMPL